MNAQQIEQHLDELGETGNAKIQNGGLYTQREENCDWLYCGAVEDAEAAKIQIAQHFEAVSLAQ